MLELTLDIPERNLVRIAEGYIHQYYEAGERKVEVPFKNLTTGKKKTVVFNLSNNEWVFSKIEE
jgi:antitoxin component YwqK of YwqJK toxin-antitoxin module